MSIVIFGADGYLGWPLTMKVARQFPNEKIVLVDNHTRRRLVQEMTGQSVTPILSLEERVRAFCDEFKQPNNFTIINLNITSPEVEDIIREYKPRLVFNLAQIGSAAYSMRGPEESVFTLTNNEVGNMRVLWAVRRHAPEAHIIKSGSMGQYAKGGIDIAEGYFYPEYNGKKAVAPVPYPRQSDDVYHITKINDSNYVSMAARKWGLSISDVMQSTVFGVHTEETRRSPLLVTRFDQDEYFGTVLNRFVSQVVSKNPITIYGTGYQRTGLMALEDALNSLMCIAQEPATKGQHRVVNNVTEKSFCIREIAEEVKKQAEARGMAAEICLGKHNPRAEDDAHKMAYDIEAHYISTRISPSIIGDVIGETMATVAKHDDRIDEKLLRPAFTW